MARKRLIKGANAARVEERIARVPADVTTLEPGPESSIFDALRALEGAAKPSPATSPASVPMPSRAGTGKAPKADAPRNRKAAAPGATAGARASRPPRRRPEPPAAAIQEAEAPKPTSRLRPSDFSAAEREAIVRCCSDYKNRLPTYLLAVQKEVKVIDSVIDKCRTVKGRGRRP